MEIRLKKNKEFLKVFSKGEKGFSNSLTVTILKSETVKFGVAVSKKHGHAVLRNRIKRLVRVAFREVMPLIKGNYHFVIVPKVCENYSLEGFTKDLRFILKKKGII